MSGAEFSGMLRERIRIERPVAQRDPLGSATPQTELVGEFWAAVEAMGTGSEAQAGSRAALQRWQFTLRETGNIRPGDQLVWDERTMVIRSIEEDRRLLPKTLLFAEEKR